MKGFDPDKRLDVSEKAEKADNKSGSFDPDKRVEINKADQVKQNKLDGCAKEEACYNELCQKYPAEKGYTISREALLRDKDGNVVKDPVSGEARRVDFIVSKDGKAVDSIEVTSLTAPKEEQMAKEERIKENGGNYYKDANGNLIEIPSYVKTRIDRRTENA